MIKIPKSLLEKLAPAEPINQDEMGGCVFCAGTPPGNRYGSADRYLDNHDKDCPWVEARLLLGDVLQESKPVAMTHPKSKRFLPG